MDARPLVAELKRSRPTEAAVRYEWIRDWDALAGLDFRDGEEWITFLQS